MRVTARILCGVLFAVAFLLLGPATEHEPAPWIATSIAAVLGICGVGLGGVVVALLASAISFNVLHDNGARAASLDFVLAIMCGFTEPWMVAADKRHPRFATSAFLFGLANVPSVILLGVLASRNVGFADRATPTIAFGALILGGGPLAFYLIQAARAQRNFPELRATKRLAIASAAYMFLWMTSLAALGTYVTH